MHLVISRKTVTPWKSQPVDNGFDLTSLIKLMGTPTASYTVKGFETLEEAEEFITKQVALGLVCHRFEHADSYKATTTIQTLRAAA